MRGEEFKIQTDRLVLRHFREEDAEALFCLNSDMDVIRYTGDDPFSDATAARQFINAYDHYQLNGFGRWAVTDRDSGEFMGFCGLRKSPGRDVVDLAYRLFRRYWAAGYATEAALASLEAGFESFGLDEITGWAMRENLPSITVLQKLGMRYKEMAEEDGVFWLVYSISAEDFRSR